MQNELFKIIIEDLKASNYNAITDSIGETITYSKLFNEAKNIAYHILKIKNSTDFVAIKVGNDWQSYALILGCWLSGKGYLPISKDLPKSRINHQLKSIESTTILEFDKVPKYEHAIIYPQNPPKWAYLLFTSGSTGTPKGVPVSWKALTAFWKHYNLHKQIKWAPKDRWLQSYALTFDVSIFVFLNCFTSFGNLFLLPEKGVVFMNIINALKKYRINITSNVPTTARLLYPKLNEVVLPDLKYSFFSGEVLKGSWAKKWMKSAPNAIVYNCYGPTETTIVCSEENLNQLAEKYFTSEKPLPIGSPFKGIIFCILENQLGIFGDQVFDGYLNQKPEAKFLNYNNKTFFLSGDVVAQNTEGKWLFEGRSDQQIKIHGYRVELQEIETLVQKHHNLFSVVLFWKDYLFLFIEGKQNKLIASTLKNNLPWYMQPKQIIAISSIPLTKNQKPNRKKLIELIS